MTDKATTAVTENEVVWGVKNLTLDSVWCLVGMPGGKHKCALAFLRFGPLPNSVVCTCWIVYSRVNRFCLLTWLAQFICGEEKISLLLKFTYAGGWWRREGGQHFRPSHSSCYWKTRAGKMDLKYRNVAGLQELWSWCLPHLLWLSLSPSHIISPPGSFLQICLIFIQ